MSPQWLDDELNKQHAKAALEAQRIARQNVEAELIAQRAAGLMLELIHQVRDAVGQYCARTEQKIDLQVHGDTGFSVTGLRYPVSHIGVDLNGRTVNVRHVVTKAIGIQPQTKHWEIGFSVDNTDTVYFRAAGRDMTAEKLTEELLRPVLFPN